MNQKNMEVAVHFTKGADYPSRAPFDPPENYPEHSAGPVDPENPIYAGVRETLRLLGLDKENFNTKDWNPFKGLIQPGMTVFIKPNTVRDNHKKKKDVLSVIVHASVLRPILDYVLIALKNKGKIIIGDSQSIFSHFDKAMRSSRIDDLLKYYKIKTKIPIDCMDLRIKRGARTWLYGKWRRVPIEQDTSGYKFVDLMNHSSFNGIDPKKLGIAIAPCKNMYKHHSNGKHEYLFPKSLLESDVIISIPKLKTHRRTAVTLALKNAMGFPSLKDSLPHYTIGSTVEGGDQYIHASFRKKVCTMLHDKTQTSPYTIIKGLCAIAKKLIWHSSKVVPFGDQIYEGMWYGNDTLWRTLLDLNKIILYANKEGVLCNAPQRRLFYVVDGVIGGEKEGPSSPDPVASRILFAGCDSVSIDAVGSSYMGFDFKKIPMIDKAFNDRYSDLPVTSGNEEDIQISVDDRILSLSTFVRSYRHDFEPHPNWKGHVEIESFDFIHNTAIPRQKKA